MPETVATVAARAARAERDGMFASWVVCVSCVYVVCPGSFNEMAMRVESQICRRAGDAGSGEFVSKHQDKQQRRRSPFI